MYTEKIFIGSGPDFTNRTDKRNKITTRYYRKFLRHDLKFAQRPSKKIGSLRLQISSLLSQYDLGRRQVFVSFFIAQILEYTSKLTLLYFFKLTIPGLFLIYFRCFSCCLVAFAFSLIMLCWLIKILGDQCHCFAIPINLWIGQLKQKSCDTELKQL